MSYPPVYDQISLQQQASQASQPHGNRSYVRTPSDYDGMPSVLLDTSGAGGGVGASARQLRTPSIAQYSLLGGNNITQNILNTSTLSFDLMNPNPTAIKTRYDVKSATSGASSLYGSRHSITTSGAGVGGNNYISTNTNGNVVASAASALRSSKRYKVKKYFLGKFFPDDAYSVGEYEKNSYGLSNMDGKATEEDLEDTKRESWSGKFDFFLSCLGYAVGLGAVWRFPYLCYKNGGGVFLIPYFIFLFLAGIPLFYIELNLGQYTSQGPILCWKMAPIFKGLGISMNIISFYFCLYYNMIIAYSLYYLFYSFDTKLPWSKCDWAWASPNCTDDFGENFVIRCDQADVYRDLNGLCYNYSINLGRTSIGWWDVKKRLEFRKPVLPSQDYYYNAVLQQKTQVDGSSEIIWQLALALLLAWVLVFLCIFRGIKSSGKIVYFTSLFPYLVLLILGIRGWTLPGAGKGIEFYLKPDFSRILDIRIWFDAAVQIFFTMSTSYGGLITLASYNKFNQNTLRDTFVITISNALTAIFAGFVVFSYIGYLAQLTHQNVSDVVSSGSGLSFIVFPFAVTQLAGAPFWSVIFFIMMLTLGLDSEFATLETIITSIVDVFPKTRKFKTILILGMCIGMFLLGLPYCTRGGIYWIEMMDKFSSGWAVLIIGFFEFICIGYVYGYKNFHKDIKLMTGNSCHNPICNWYWNICWLVVSPLLLLILIVVSWVQYEPLKIDNYVLPDWMNLIGWLMTASVLSGMFGWALYMVIDALFIHKRSLKTLFKPEKDWGPRSLKNMNLATHLGNLEHIHDSKRRAKQQPDHYYHVNAIST